MMRPAIRLSALHWAIVALVLSVAFQFACFARWPREPMSDVGYSIFAAQNLLAHGQLKGINILADYHDDLAQYARLHWMVHYPPGHSLLYAAAMSLGLNPSDATKALVLVGMLAGGLGWIMLGRLLGASRHALLLLAAFYPWLPWVADAYTMYETENVAFALMPWFCLALLRVAPVGEAAPHHGRQLARVILIAFALILLKYSMSPVFLAAGLYLIWLDGRAFVQRSIVWKLAVAALLAFPLILSLLVSYAYGPRLTAVGTPPITVIAFARNLLNNSVSATLGWDGVVGWVYTLLNLHPVKGLVFILSLASLAVAIVHVRRHPPEARLRPFARLLILLTLSLWLSLATSTWLASQQWNFAADPRFYMPITLLWLLWFAVALDAMGVRRMLRTPAFYALALPLVLTAAIGAKAAIGERGAPAMPRTGLAWTASRSPEHAVFLSNLIAARGRKPDVLIGLPPIMNELDAPSLYSGYLIAPGHRYWSSTPLEVWALVPPSQEAPLRAAFIDAAAERVVTPPGYPYIVYIFSFPGSPHAAPRAQQ